MTIRKLPVKPQVSESRKGQIDVFFKSKNRYPEECFLEVEYLIKSPNGQKYFERGYSQTFIPTNRVELIEAQESAQLNAIGKVLYRDGFSFDESDDIREFRGDFEIGDIEILDYLFYYTRFKGENIRTSDREEQGFETVTFVKQDVQEDTYTKNTVKENEEVNKILQEKSRL